MKLIINNIAKIKHAEIEFNGVTVIAGNNDTGKSTIGKTLFALFNSLNDIENKLVSEKNETLHRAFSLILRELLPVDREASLRLQVISKYSYVVTRILNLFSDVSVFDEMSIRASIVDILRDDFQNKVASNNDDLYNKVAEAILSEYKRISKIPDKSAMLTIVSRYFSSIFDNQIVSLNSASDLNADAELVIKGKKVKASFLDGVCHTLIDEVDITKKSIYIDNPFVLDRLQESQPGAYVDQFLQFILLQSKSIVLEKGAYDSVDITDKLTNVEFILNDIINGSVVEKDSDFILQKDNLSEGIHLQNVSTGLKSFILLKLLLQKELLTTKDVLVLDEPEIHLHPEWQLKYAEAIVLLQKAFDLNVVITTHSATFLEAIDLYSKKYDMKDKCKYYLSAKTTGDEQAEFEDVTQALDKVYKSLVTPTMALMRLREQLEREIDD